MSLSLALPTAATVDWKPISWRLDWQNIFRTPAAKISAEVLTLACVSIGLFSLFLGLSVL